MTLKDYRKMKKLTQKEMAKLIGISYSMYMKVEQNVRQPGLNTLKKIKKVFNDFPIEFFLN